MRLFPTVHATVPLPDSHREHLQRHGLVLVGADERPDVVLLAADAIVERPEAPGVVVLPAGGAGGTPDWLHRRGVDVRAAVPSTMAVGRPQPGAACGPDLLAWTSGSPLPVVAELDTEHGAAVRVSGPFDTDGARGPAVVAAVDDDEGRLVVLGVDVLGAGQDGAELLLNAVSWAAPPLVDDASRSARTELPAAWTGLRDAVQELRALQGHDGSVPDEAAHARAAELVATVSAAVSTLVSEFPHDEDYLVAVTKDLARWVDGGFGVPDFLDSLVLFHPERARVDALRHLVVFPMYTQNGSTDRRFEAVLLEVRWPDEVARLEAERFPNPMFVPVRFLGFTGGYDTHSAVLFPETVAVREVPAFTWGAIFADREAARFRRVVRAAADTTRLALPPDAARLLADQRLAEEAFVLWDLVHDRTHMRGDLPFDPFMIKQRMPYFLYSLEELRCDLTAFRAAVELERDGVPHARLVQYAIVFDRIFRFPVSGTRVRNYDGLGGQLLFAWLHQHHVLDWTDSRLRIDWRRVPEAVIALAEQIEQLYWRSIDRPKTAHWLAAYALVSGTVDPHPASVWARGPDALPLDGPPKGLTDAVLDDEFPLSMFYEALSRKIADLVASTSGITG